MKNVFTLLITCLSFAFSMQAQVQLGSSLMGSAVSEFGQSVTISGDGSRIASAAPNVGYFGHIDYYEYNSMDDSWLEMPNDPELIANVGNIIRLSDDGERAIVFNVAPQYFEAQYNDTLGWQFVTDDFTNQTVNYKDIAINSDATRVLVGTETETRIYTKEG